jgi:hypothetical protein
VFLLLHAQARAYTLCAAHGYCTAIVPAVEQVTLSTSIGSMPAPCSPHGSPLHSAAATKGFCT